MWFPPEFRPRDPRVRLSNIRTITVLAVVGSGPYTNLGYRSLALAPGTIADPYTYEGEFIFEDAPRPYGQGDPCLIALALGPADLKGLCVVPIRFGRLRDMSTAVTGSVTWTVELANTFSYHSRECMLQQGIKVSAYFGANCRADRHAFRQQLLTDRGLPADHPFLVRNLTADQLMTATSCQQCSAERTRFENGSLQQYHEDDADAWNHTTRHLQRLIKAEGYPTNGVIQGSVRIVGIQKAIGTNSYADDQLLYVPLHPPRSAAMIVNQARLRRRETYYLILQSRQGPFDPPAVDDEQPKLNAEVSAPEHLLRVENREIEIPAATVRHVLRLYVRNRRGVGNVLVRVRQSRKGMPAPGQFELPLPIEVMRRWPPISTVTGVLFLLVGLMIEVASVAVRSDAQTLKVPTSSLLVAAGLMIAVVGGGLIGLQIND